MENILTSTQVCQLFGISPKTLYHWEKDEKIRAAGRDRRGWRVYGQKQLKSIRHFLGLKDSSTLPAGSHKDAPKPLPKLSARNQLAGVVTALRIGGLMAEVVVRLGDGQEVVSIVTKNSVQRLGIKKGEPATAVIKSTEVMLFK